MSQAPDPEFETPCTPPAEGWGVLDAAKTSQESMDATFTAASALPGFAGSWISQPLDPGVENGVMDLTKVIINVAVTEDVEGAEPSCGRRGAVPCASARRRTPRAS